MLAEMKNVVLRRLSPSDVEAFHAYRSDAAVARYQGWSMMTRENAIGFLSDMATVDILVPGQWTQLGLAHRAKDALFGDVGIHVSTDETEAELGISLSRDAQGLGLGYDAVSLVTNWIFDQTAVKRIVAITDARNAAALRLLVRTPFVHTHDTSETEDGTLLNECWFELGRNSDR